MRVSNIIHILQNTKPRQVNTEILTMTKKRDNQQNGRHFRSEIDEAKTVLPNPFVCLFVCLFVGG